MKLQVATFRNAREVLVELVERRARETKGHGAGVLHGAGAPQQSAYPVDGGGGSRGAGPREKRGQLPALVVAAVAQGVNDHQRALAFQKIAVDLLAVRRARGEVQQVVLDLERGAVEESQAYQRVERQAPARADQAADPQRMDRAQPARLLQHHAQVVLIGHVGAIVALASPARAPGLRCSPRPCARSPRRCATRWRGRAGGCCPSTGAGSATPWRLRR